MKVIFSRQAFIISAKNCSSNLLSELKKVYCQAEKQFSLKLHCNENAYAESAIQFFVNVHKQRLIRAEKTSSRLRLHPECLSVRMQIFSNESMNLGVVPWSEVMPHGCAFACTFVDSWILSRVNSTTNYRSILNNFVSCSSRTQQRFWLSVAVTSKHLPLWS